jgi:RNA ligase (TIGR02306 family)
MPQRKLARIETVLAITPIPNADRIEAVTVGGWVVVAQKGLYTVGSLVTYFELDSLIPRRPWSLFLFKDNRELYRLKSVRLKQQLSQGLLVPITQIPELAGRDWKEGDDLTELLGIQKWEMVLPAHLAGMIKGVFPPFIIKTDEPRLQSNRGVLAEIQDVPVYISIKLDGSSFTAYRKDSVFGVCSRNLDLKEEGGDAYWAAAKSHGLHERLPEGYAVQCELVGPGIQGNKLGLTERKLYAFNVWDIAAARHLDFEPFLKFVHDVLGMEAVPILSSCVFNRSLDEWIAFADAQNYPNGSPAEGIVVRPVTERRSVALDSRLSFKVISNRFLLKTGE